MRRRRRPAIRPSGPRGRSGLRRCGGSSTSRSSSTSSPGVSSAGGSTRRCGRTWPWNALEQALHARPDRDGLVHHSDRGTQYLSIRYTERLAAAGLEPSVGSVGDSYDNALAESVIGLYKTEVIRRQGPWRHVEAVEFATLA